MRNGWTGGQYSLLRFLLGAYLFIHFVHLLPWSGELFSSQGMLPDATLSPLSLLFPNVLTLFDAPAVVVGLVGAAAAAAICLALGVADRWMAIFLWYALACVFGRNPLIANPALPYVGWLLLAHAFVPARPYGSWEARHRPDPAGGWEMPAPLFLAAWTVLAVSYSYSGYTKLLSPSWVSGDNVALVLQNPLARDYFLRDLFLAMPPVLLKLLTWSILLVELLFVPLVLFPKARPWAWSAMFVVQLGFAFLLDFADLTAGMILFHLATFDPAWMRARPLAEGATLYYDGECALCHGFVRFLLAEDRFGRLAFAPIQGLQYRERVGAEDPAGGFSSIVLVDGDAVLRKSAAASRSLEALGGYWRLLGLGIRVLPPALRDTAYDLVGAVRYRLFGRTDALCPILPAQLRDRVLP